MKPILVAVIIFAAFAQVAPRASSPQQPAGRQSAEPPVLRANPGLGIQVRDGVISVAPEVAQQIHAAGGIDFPRIPGQECADRLIDMPGASPGDTLAAAWPPTIEQGLVGMAFVGVSNKAVVRLCNVTSKAIDPPNFPFAVRVIRGY